MINLGAIARQVHELAVRKGWWPHGTGASINVNEVLAKLALVHSEISEAVEAARAPANFNRLDVVDKLSGKPEGFGIELADAAIRIFDLACALGIDIEACILLKHEYNESRPHRHGDKLA